MTQSILTERSHPAAIPSLTDAIQTHLGRELRVLYGNPAAEKMPQGLAQLLNRVAQVIGPTRSRWTRPSSTSS
jgi:RNA polymerase sigma-70 factor (ECF subfamily)